MMRLTTALRAIRALLVAALAGAPGAAQGQPDPDTAAWEAARAAGTVDACQRYLEEFPMGRYAEEAFRCVIEQALPGAGPVPMAGGTPQVDLY